MCSGVGRCRQAASQLARMYANNPLHSLLAYVPACTSTFCAAATLGNVTINRACAHCQSGLRCPWCAFTTPFEMRKPSPVPCPTTLVVKNGCVHVVTRFLKYSVSTVYRRYFHCLDSSHFSGNGCIAATELLSRFSRTCEISVALHDHAHLCVSQRPTSRFSVLS